MNNLEKLVAEAMAIEKADDRLRARRRRLVKKLQDCRGDIVISDNVIYQVTEDEYPSVLRIGDMP